MGAGGEGAHSSSHGPHDAQGPRGGCSCADGRRCTGASSPLTPTYCCQVSTDYVNDARSGIVDEACTQVIDKRLVKIYAWCEWGCGKAGSAA